MKRQRYIKKETKVYRPHPIWKPIGFLLMIFVPLLSFALAGMVMDWLLLNVQDIKLHVILQSDPINIWGDWVVQNLPATILLTIGISIFLFLILSLLNSIMYSMNSDKNLTALNAPPIKRKKKKRKLRKL